MAKHKPKTQLAPNPWPACPKCKSAKTGPGAPPPNEPPDPVFVKCQACGHVWQICGSVTRAGKRCRKSFMANGRCDIHGGKATGRPIIHGRRSKFLPQRLMERAEEALRDPELVGLLEDIALTEALMIERLGQLGEESHSDLWRQAAAAFEALKERRASGELAMEPEAGAEFDLLGRILENGQGRVKAEGEILRLQEHKRKLSETEIKRQHVLNQFVSAKELNLVAAALLSAVQKCVSSPDERRAVGVEFVGILRQRPS